MQTIPITFEHKGNRYTGYFQSVAGAGSSQIFHLMIDNYYYGRLRTSDRGWVFDSNSGMEDMAQLFGEHIKAFYNSCC